MGGRGRVVEVRTRTGQVEHRGAAEYLVLKLRIWQRGEASRRLCRERKRHKKRRGSGTEPEEPAKTREGRAEAAGRVVKAQVTPSTGPGPLHPAAETSFERWVRYWGSGFSVGGRCGREGEQASGPRREGAPCRWQVQEGEALSVQEAEGPAAVEPGQM